MLKTLSTINTLCRDLNEICKEKQDGEKEYINSEDAFLALFYMKNILMKDSGDVLLFCASCNLLNTYVKQKDSLLGYGFKNKINHLVTFSTISQLTTF